MIPLLLSFFRCIACQNQPPDSRSFPLCQPCQNALIVHPEHLPLPLGIPPGLATLSASYLLYEQSYEVLKKWKQRHSSLFDRQILSLPIHIHEKLQTLQIDAIVPVPQNPERLWKTESQTEKIATRMSEQLCRPIHYWLRYDPLETSLKQSQQDLLHRKTTHLPIKLSAQAKEARGKRILLVDDFFTSGRTLSTAARLLLQAQASVIHGFCLGIRLQPTIDHSSRTELSKF